MSQHGNDALHDDRRPSFIWIDLVIDEIGLTPDEFRVYAHLCRRAGRNGDAFPSYASIGEYCFRAKFPNAKTESLRRKAMRAMSGLIEKGLVAKEERIGHLGQTISNNYRIRDVKAVTPPVTTHHPPGDNRSTPPVTTHHPPSDNRSTPPVTTEAPLEIDPFKIDPIETDPIEIIPPLPPQRGDESEGLIEVELISDPEAHPTDCPTEKESTALVVPKKEFGEDKIFPGERTEPFLHRKSGLMYQKEKALAQSLRGSPFDSVEEQDEFFSQHLSYLRATSPNLTPGQITAIAKAALKRIMAGLPDPEDRRVLNLWASGQLVQFRGLEYSPQAIAREKQRAKSLEILEKIQRGEPLYES